MLNQSFGKLRVYLHFTLRVEYNEALFSEPLLQ